MAIGRIKDPILKVFGNDYPTLYVLLNFEAISFLMNPRDGTCVRDYIHVIDLASGHLLALDALAPESTIFQNNQDGVSYKAYNLGKGKPFSVLQILEAMRKATGFDYKYEVIGRRCAFFFGNNLLPTDSCCPAVETYPISLRIQLWLRRSLVSGLLRTWKPCAGICGTGKPRTLKDMSRRKAQGDY